MAFDFRVIIIQMYTVLKTLKQDNNIKEKTFNIRSMMFNEIISVSEEWGAWMRVVGILR